MSNRRLRCGGQPRIHRATLVGLDVAEGDPPQPFHRERLRHSLGYGGEEPPQPGMEQQRLTGVDQVLVGHNVGGAHIGGQPVDVRRPR